MTGIKIGRKDQKHREKSGNVEIIAVLGRKECEVQMQ